MAGLPKKYAKMGFKRGWRMFKASKRGRSRVLRTSTKKKGGSTMARRRRYAKKKSYRRSKSNVMGSVTKHVIGAALALGFETFISPMIPVAGMMKNFVELIIGVALMTMRGVPSIAKSGGVALVIINAYQIIGEFVGGGNAQVSQSVR